MWKCLSLRLPLGDLGLSSLICLRMWPERASVSTPSVPVFQFLFILWSKEIRVGSGGVKGKASSEKEMGSRCAGVAERSQTLHARPKADPKTFLVNERALSALCWALNHVEEAEGGLVSQKQAKRISFLQFLSLSFSIQLPFAYLIFTHNNQFWQMSATTAGNYRLRK